MDRRQLASMIRSITDRDGPGMDSLIDELMEIVQHFDVNTSTSGVLSSVLDYLDVAQRSEWPESVDFVSRFIASELHQSNDRLSVMYKVRYRQETIVDYFKLLKDQWHGERYREDVLEGYSLIGPVGPACQMVQPNVSVIHDMMMVDILRQCANQNEALAAITLVNMIESDGMLVFSYTSIPSDWAADSARTLVQTAKMSLRNHIPLEWALAANDKIKRRR